MEQIGSFIEKGSLRHTNFPLRASSAIHILALGLAKANLVFKVDEAEMYVVKHLERIRDGGYNILEEIFREIAD